MAIDFARVTIHSRSKGHSAVAGAAYRSGMALEDERTGETHDFHNRQDVVYSNIMLPDDADKAFLDRQYLWNQIEAAEKRKDAQVAKDIVIALPKEVEHDKQIELARQFAYNHFVKHGLAVDIAIHSHSNNNPHAHLYVTTRRIIGKTIDRYKARDLNPSFLNSKGSHGFISEQDHWNKKWREHQNEYFNEHSINLEVDANYLIPQKHEGRIRGQEAHYTHEENQLRYEACVELALHHPTVVLNELTQYKTVFSDKDIDWILTKNTNSESQKIEALSAIKSDSSLISLGLGEDGRERYTTTSSLEAEMTLSEHAEQLARKKATPAPLSMINAITQQYHLNSEQADALYHLAQNKDITAIVGRAGTGKSYMMNAARELFEKEGYRVQGMSLSSVAASGLEKEAGIKSHTIAYYKKLLSHDTWHLDTKSVVVMDEAGMTDLDDMLLVVRHVQQSGAKLVLVGDHAQLQAIGKGAPFKAIVEQIGFAEMNKIMRQKDASDCAATLQLAKGDIGHAIDHYCHKNQVHLLKKATDAQKALIADWKNTLQKNQDLSTQLILAHSKADVTTLNTLARESLIKKAALGEESLPYQAVSGRLEVRTGERLLFLKNDKSCDLKNGQFATVQSMTRDTITVLRDSDQKTITFSADDYKHFDYGYASTVHKTQGVTLLNTFVYASGRMWDRFLTYVALSRHKDTTSLYASQEDFNNIDDLKRKLSRDTTKDSVLDYPLSFSIRRGFDAEATAKGFVAKVSKVKNIVKDKWLFISNYETYVKQRQTKAQDEETLQRRDQARIVAEFVDLHRSLGKSWADVQQDLKANNITRQELYKNTAYKDLLAQTHYKNKLAVKIASSYDTYQRAMDLNHVTRDTIDKAAATYHKTQLAQNYIRAYQTGSDIRMQQYARSITKDIKDIYPQLATESGINGLRTKELIQAAKVQSIKANYYEAKKQAHTREAKERLETAYAYIQLQQTIKQRWSLIYQYQAQNQLSKQQLIQYQCDTFRLDALGATLYAGQNLYKDVIDLFSIDVDTIKASYEKHRYRSTVQEYAKSLEKQSQEKLAHDILSDRGHYRFVYEAELDWKQLAKDQKSFLLAQRREGLSKAELKAMDHVIAYQKSRIESGKAWSHIFAEKDKGETIDKITMNKAFDLNQARNQLAYTMFYNLKDYTPYFKDIKIKIDDLEKHALSHSKILQKERKIVSAQHKSELHRKAVQTATAFDKEKGQWRYESVSRALSNMGVEFYERILDMKGKREGAHSLRFGQGHALVYSYSGDKAGSWHSFASGEGGGALQLLMSAQHGWGLSYQDALKEGARIAGLSPDAVSTYKVPKAKKLIDYDQKHTKEQLKKIKSAQYYYQSAQPIEGTLGEKYLRQHRHIIGDIKHVRFHPKIKDVQYDKQTNQKKVSYHPGIVVASFNDKGEMTASQTTLLDPKTANKTSSHSVGVVKRSRGVVKGSAVPVQLGTSNKIILAEGLETALSLTQVEKEANIYVTLGNIKNAESLTWLCDKHQTKDLYFAADFDPQTNHTNVKAIETMAKSFKEHNQITTHIAQPHLKDSPEEKCDFNDVLQKYGIDEVNKQLGAWKSIHIEKPEVYLSKEDLKDRVRQALNDDPKLKAYIDDLSTQRKSIRKEHNDTLDKKVDVLIKNYQSLLVSEHKEENLNKKMDLKKEIDTVASNIHKNKPIMDRIKTRHEAIYKAIDMRAQMVRSKSIDKDIDR